MFIRSSAFAVLPVVALWCVVWASAAAQTVAPHEAAEHALGPLTVAYTVDGVRARIKVDLRLANQPVGQTVLTPEAPHYRFNVAAGADRASGTLSATFAAPPDLSSLDSVFETATATAAWTFRGAVATWVAGTDLIYIERTYDLSPEVQAHTTVRGAAKAQVRVELYAGSAVLYVVNMIQASPVAVIADELVLGDVRIAAGAKFTLTIPTPQQKGQVLMQGKFSSRSIPETSIAAAIAVWSR